MSDNIISNKQELLKLYKISPDEILDFLCNKEQRVEVLRLEDYNYGCFINYQQDNQACSGLGMTPLEAILNAIHNTNKEKS